MEPLDLDYMPGITDAIMDDIAVPNSVTMNAHGNSTIPPPSRSMDPAFMHPPMYPLPGPYPSAGPAQHPSNGPTGPYATGPMMQPNNVAYTKIESVSDLLLPDTLDFEYNHELDATLHTGKCAECVRFCLHILRPGVRTKFRRATVAHEESIANPLRIQIAKLNEEAHITAKTLVELKDALQTSQKSAASLQEQRDKFRQDYDELLMEHRTKSQRVADLEQQISAVSHRRPYSPTRGSRHRSPTRTGTRHNTPYDRPDARRTTQNANSSASETAPIILDSNSDGHTIMAIMPTNIRSAVMHKHQPRYRESRPWSATDYPWKTNENIDIIGLPTTRAGTFYIPNDTGLGWFELENQVSSVDDVYRRIDLIFRDREGEPWRAAARGAYEFRRLATPVPAVMEYLLRLHTLRKSVWAVVNESVRHGADLTAISPGCRLYTDGYAGLFTPDIQLWAVLNTATDVDPSKLTSRTGRTSTTPELKKMFKDVICSGNFFELSPAELAAGVYRLPRLAHYNGALDMNAIADWLRNTIGMTPYMVHAHFRPFLRRVHESTLAEHHPVFSPDQLFPNEVVPPITNETLPDFADSCDWTPSRGPRQRFTSPSHFLPPGAPTNAPSAAAASTANPSVPITSKDTNMTDSGATPTNVLSVAPQSATTQT